MYIERVESDDKSSDVYQEHIERYKFAARFVQGKVLDIACGTGYGSEMLAESGAEEVWAGDIESQVIKDKGTRFLLTDEKEKERTVEFRDPIHDGEYAAHISSRRLGEDTGRDILLDLGGQFQNIVQSLKANLNLGD